MWKVREVSPTDFEAINRLNFEQLTGHCMFQSSSISSSILERGKDDEKSRRALDFSQSRITNLYYTPESFCAQILDQGVLFCLIENARNRPAGYLCVRMCKPDGKQVYASGVMVSNLYFCVERFYLSRRDNHPELGKKLFEHFEQWRAQILNVQKQ